MPLFCTHVYMDRWTNMFLSILFLNYCKFQSSEIWINEILRVKYFAPQPSLRISKGVKGLINR